MQLKRSHPFFRDVILFFNGLYISFSYADITPDPDVWDDPIFEQLMYSADTEVEMLRQLTHGQVFGVFSVH